jgi:hypothetical protein
LEHPTGLRYDKVCAIAMAKDNRLYVGAKGTVDRLLSELTSPPSPLVVKEKGKFGRYVLNLVEPIQQIISDGGPQVSDQIDKFLKILYENCDFNDEKQKQMCWSIGITFLQSKFTKIFLTTSILLRFFSDAKVRELWLHSQGFIFDLIYQKMDEIAEKFSGIKNYTSKLENSDEMAEYVSSRIEPVNKQMAEIDLIILNLICNSSMTDDTKRRLIAVSNKDSKSLTQIISKQEKASKKLIGALKEAKKNIS